MWESGIREAIENSLPPLAQYESPDRMGNILQSLMAGKLECWTLWKGEDIQIVGTFQVLLDAASMTKNLLIYSLYAYVEVGLDLWGTLWKLFAESAKQQKCSRLVGYTNVDRIKLLNTGFNFTIISSTF